MNCQLIAILFRYRYMKFEKGKDMLYEALNMNLLPKRLASRKTTELSLLYEKAFYS